MSSRSGLFIGHVYKVRIVKRFCLQGQDCLESLGCLVVMCSRSGLFRDHVYKVRVV